MASVIQGPVLASPLSVCVDSDSATSTFSSLSLMGLVTCHFLCADHLLRQCVWREVKGFLMVP